MRSRNELIGRVAEQGGGDAAHADKMVRVTLAVLGECLTPDEAVALERDLPESLAALVAQAGYDGPATAAELYERVRRRAGEAPGRAREDAQIVLRALGEDLDETARERLLHALPREIGELLLPRDEGEPPAHVHPSHAPPLTTLAAGRPGSTHPLSEAAPPPGQSHSVVREDNPHGETKLSSSRGLTQERLGESIASGRAGPRRPLASTRAQTRAERGAREAAKGGHR